MQLLMQGRVLDQASDADHTMNQGLRDKHKGPSTAQVVDPNV